MRFSAISFLCGEAKYIWAHTVHMALSLLAEYPRIKRTIFVNVLKGISLQRIIFVLLNDNFLRNSLLYVFQYVVALQIKISHFICIYVCLISSLLSFMFFNNP
jgi:hypothetical protein